MFMLIYYSQQSGLFQIFVEDMQTLLVFCVVFSAFLDYYDVPYKVVEVNPFSKKEIKWSEYKKVPILMVDGEPLVDSSGMFFELVQVKFGIGFLSYHNKNKLYRMLFSTKSDLFTFSKVIDMSFEDTMSLSCSYYWANGEQDHSSESFVSDLKWWWREEVAQVCFFCPM